MHCRLAVVAWKESLYPICMEPLRDVGFPEFIRRILLVESSFHVHERLVCDFILHAVVVLDSI